MNKKSWGAHQRQIALVVLVLGSVLGCNVPQDEEGAEVEATDLSTIAQGVVFNKHDYLFVTTSRSWSEAKAQCEGQGYRLVTVDTPEEQAFLRNQQAATGLSLWWIGYNDRMNEGVWVWDGANSTTSYTNWAPGEPNSRHSLEDCAIDGWAGQWNDGSCSDAFPFVCEKDLSLDSGFFSYSASNTSSATVNTYNYAVYLPAGRILTLGTCGVAGASGSGDTYLRLNNPSGQEIASNDDAGGSCGLLSNLSITTPSAGTYVIRAGCYGSGSCSGTVAFTY